MLQLRRRCQRHGPLQHQHHQHHRDDDDLPPITPSGAAVDAVLHRVAALLRRQLCHAVGTALTDCRCLADPRGVSLALTESCVRAVFASAGATLSCDHSSSSPCMQIARPASALMMILCISRSAVNSSRSILTICVRRWSATPALGRSAATSTRCICLCRQRAPPISLASSRALSSHWPHCWRRQLASTPPSEAVRRQRRAACRLMRCRSSLSLTLFELSERAPAHARCRLVQRARPLPLVWPSHLRRPAGCRHRGPPPRRGVSPLPAWWTWPIISRRTPPPLVCVVTVLLLLSVCLLTYFWLRTALLVSKRNMEFLAATTSSTGQRSCVFFFCRGACPHIVKNSDSPPCCRCQ